MAKKINLGKVGITTEGAYDSSKAYEKLSCVTYNHESWVSTKDVPAGNAPDNASPFWQKMSARGEQGIQGPVGPQGNSAFDGNGVEIVNNLTQGGEAAVLSAEQGKILKNEVTELSEEVNGLSDKLFTSINLINPQEVDFGKYIYNGKLANNSDYNTTGFIGVVPNLTYALIATGGHTEANARFISFFDADKKWVSDGASYLKEVTIPSGIAYMRVSYDTLYWNTAQINLGAAIPFQDYAEIINPNLFKDIDFSKVNTLTSFRDSQTLASSDVVELPLNYVSRNVEISASFSGDLQSVEVGLGKDTFFGGHLEITPQNISIYDGGSKITTMEHGLTFGNKVYVSIKTADVPNSYGNKTAAIRLRSNGTEYKTTSYFSARGKAYVKNNGSNSIEASISFFPCNATTPIWMFGDSYFEWADKTRWITQAVNDGNKRFMDCAIGGGKSDTAMTAYANLLTLGLPKIAVWCLGMNDGNDAADAPSALWLSNIKSFIAVCERNSITPILATIPSVPSVNNEKKNEWVRNSGYRYIDFAAAVGATSSGQWDEGLLSADGVHPSEKGGIMLYAQALVDCPEIANS